MATGVCGAEEIRKASVLAVFGAIRASMKRLEEARLALEQLAVRLDILASTGLPVTRDPHVEALLESLASMRLDGFEWILEELCRLLSCMSGSCSSSRGERG